MRAGTSRGLFFRLEDLPVERAEWREVILGAMGSPDPYLRQLDGLGGGQSTSSKVAVVSRSTFPGVDIDYLFIQGEQVRRSHARTLSRA
jgi:2-methylaconitate cis-trans-isomerase PrpF